MRELKGKKLFLMAAFIAIVFGVPLTQIAVELGRRERPQVADLFLHAPSEANLRAFEKGLEDASWLAQALRPWMQYVQFAVLKDAGQNALVGRNGWLFYKPGVQYLVEPWPPKPSTTQPGPRGVTESADEDGAAAAPLHAVLAFRDQLRDRGIQLLVVPVPGKASVYPDMLTSRACGPAAPVYAHTLELVTELERAGVEVVNLFEIFAQARRSPDVLYLRQDTHWSPEGMRAAAEAVARRLLDLGWITKGTAQYNLRSVAIQRQGDVIRMMQAPRLARLFTPQDVTCQQVMQADTGGAYQDEPGGEVLVLGDSFLRIYQRDEPGAAGFIAHLAREIQAPVASIVNDGGASTLVRQELNRKPALLAGKKVVVWEFVERDIRFGTEGWQDVPLPRMARADAAR